jgi:hypothetical protein
VEVSLGHTQNLLDTNTLHALLATTMVMEMVPSTIMGGLFGPQKLRAGYFLAEKVLKSWVNRLAFWERPNSRGGYDPE